MPGFAAAGLALSAVSAYSGSQSAGDAQDYQNAQLGVEQRRDAFNRDIVTQENEWTQQDRKDFQDRQERERGLLDPIQEGIVQLAQAGPDYETAMGRSDADVAQSYGLQRDMEQRRQSKYGINPASGVAASESRRSGNEEALARIHGRSRARKSEDDQDWARKFAAFGTGNISNAQAGGNLSQLGVSGQSGVLGSMAASSAANASGAYQLSGKLFADAQDTFSSNNDYSAGPTGSPDYDDYSYWE
jgi:hypothetical protein